MSPLVVLGLLGTLISTITIVPHVIHAVRTKKPSGSPLAWALGATGSLVWFIYGIASGDLLVGAPGLITIPCGVMLAAWSIRSQATTAAPLLTPAGTPIAPAPTLADLAQPLLPAGQIVHAVTDTGTIRAVRLLDPVTVFEVDRFRSGDTIEMPALV